MYLDEIFLFRFLAAAIGGSVVYGAFKVDDIIMLYVGLFFIMCFICSFIV